jgi:hypothetical protein
MSNTVKLLAVSVQHRHGFGCIGLARTQEGADAIINDWTEEFPEDKDEDEFDISEVEFDLDSKL